MEKKLMLVFLTLAMLAAVPVMAIPDASTNTAGTQETANQTVATNVSVDGGYINTLDLAVESQTNRWQGFYGEVSGKITLEAADGNKMFQWVWQNTDSGEVYASEAPSVTWASMAAGNVANVPYVNEATTTKSDSAADTFTISGNSWVVGDRTVSEVKNVKTYDSTGAGTFEEGLLYDGTNYVFVSKLYNNADDFDSATGTTSDFQMIVPTPEADTTTSYYFWVELS